ncbi:double-strand break repair protein AddB [Oceanomicrobium pacificus]|uniref:Double-strand break repair protein AddB n=1 Tax=Oceanomicrobium pacificus TaxID=2692916 RepID=A0A6B0TSG4_9RHOB|nr:double-strand break repair protein AddB [Oceanomicrobium pacificus]MXU64745.1 double-strand break repair protein AddB [Oceanomicrobium pacificus]
MTRLFPDQEGPRLFGLPLGCDPTQALYDGLRSRLEGQPPEAAARVRIYLNTRRAARALEAAFVAGGAALLPQVRVLEDLEADVPLLVDLPSPPDPLHRMLDMSQLVARLLDLEPDLAPQSARFDLAESIALFQDELGGEAVPLSRLETLDVGHQSGHWQRSLTFLKILAGSDDGDEAGTDPSGQNRQRRLVEALGRIWAEEPPDTPILIAGSTGSRGATARFMEIVANLPQGAVILPGVDMQQGPDQWQAIDGEQDHPQFGFARLGRRLGVDMAALPAFGPVASPVPDRAALLSLSLRPAPVTEQWMRDGPAHADALDASLSGVTLVEADTARLEAGAIACRMRAAAEDGRSAALITPDRVLARRVAAMLDRWQIVPDDSAGRPLSLTPPGLLLRELAALAGRRLTPNALLPILGSPLVGGLRDARRRHLVLSRRLDLSFLRGGPPFIDGAALRAWAESPKARMEEAPAWAAHLAASLDPLAGDAQLNVGGHAARLRVAAEALSRGAEPGPDAVVSLWDKAAGARAAEVLRKLEEAGDRGAPMSAGDFDVLLNRLLSAQDVRDEAFETHPLLSIWGTLEARVGTAEVMILGGLNEGVWPGSTSVDPWMNRDMRRQLDLPLPERRIGLAAHDFQQAANAPEVVLTRSVREAEAPSVAARWLVRLGNLVDGIDRIAVADGRAGAWSHMDDLRARGRVWTDLAAAVDRPLAEVPAAPRPAPCPPRAARPDKLSATRIQALIRDPYSIYARYVLNLRAVAPPGKEPDALERGTTLHEVLEKCVAAFENEPPEVEVDRFRRIAAETLEEIVPWPAVRRIWKSRLDRIAPWFVATEAERRADGKVLIQEVWGRWAVSGLSAPFTLEARVDRIDLLADGSLAIFDYKTGTPPSDAQVRQFDKQLYLEALIAQAGGFDTLAATPVGRLEYIGLGGTGSLRRLDASPDEIETHRADLVRLLTAYQDPAQPYPARTRPHKITYDSDYDQLSRRGEWDDGDDPVEVPL